jgi:DHA2 family multidrug resistance protein
MADRRVLDAPAAGWRRGILVASVLLATLLQVIDVGALSVALPQIMGTIGATLDEIAWVVTGYLIATGIVIPLSGWLGARLGRRRCLIGSVGIFTLASLLAGLAGSLQSLILFRILQGLGGGALIPMTQAILMELFPGAAGTAMGIYGMAIMVGPILGPLLGGWLTDALSWRWVFFMNVPVGVLTFLLLAGFLPESPDRPAVSRRVDLPGIACLAVGIGALQTVLSRGHRLNWFESAQVIELSGLAAVALAGFVVRELTSREPAVDLRVLRERSLGLGSLTSLMHGVASYPSFLIVPLFVQELFGYSPGQAGEISLVAAVATAAVIPVTSRLSTRFDTRWTLLGGIGLFWWAMTMLAHLTQDAGYWDLFWMQVLRGCSMGALFVPLSVAALAHVERSKVPAGTGLYNLARQLGGSAGIAMMATLLDRWKVTARSELVVHTSAFDPETRERLRLVGLGLMARGRDAHTAQAEGLRLLERTVQRQAAALAFGDVLRFLVLVMVVSIPLVACLRPPRPRARRPGAAA